MTLSACRNANDTRWGFPVAEFAARRLILWLVLCVIAYLASYAPFLRIEVWRDAGPTSPYYRSPTLYRPAEWLIVTSQNVAPVQLWWARLFGVKAETELQAFFFAQQIEDTSEMHFNLL